jgi:hypothetical protein
MKDSETPFATAGEILLAVVVLGIFASFTLPIFSSASKQSLQNKALQQSKGIFYGLKMFATDHNGRFPTVVEEDFDSAGEHAPAITDANHAYANIVPTYVQSENPFQVSVSVYCHDASGKEITAANDFSVRGKVLIPGCNHWAYVLGLKDTADPAFPLIADGFAGGPGAVTDPVYAEISSHYGGAWSGVNAIVVRCDGSSSLLPVDRRSLTVRRTDKPTANLFTPGTDPIDPWLKGCTVLNPLQNH